MYRIIGDDKTIVKYPRGTQILISIDKAGETHKPTGVIRRCIEMFTAAN